MARTFYGFIAILGTVTVPSAVSAQSAEASQPGIFVPPVGGDYYNSNLSSPSFASDGLTTPTMRRQRLITMIALRDELHQLRAADGGTLSDENRAYLTRKANRLLSR